MDGKCKENADREAPKGAEYSCGGGLLGTSSNVSLVATVLTAANLSGRLLARCARNGLLATYALPVDLTLANVERVDGAYV